MSKEAALGEAFGSIRTARGNKIPALFSDFMELPVEQYWGDMGATIEAKVLWGNIRTALGWQTVQRLIEVMPRNQGRQGPQAQNSQSTLSCGHC